MKSLPLVVMLVGLGSGAVGAVAGVLLLDTTRPEPGAVVAGPARVATPSADGAGLAALRERLDALDVRLASLEARPVATSSRAPVAALSAEDEAFEEQLRELAGALPEIHATVSKALLDIREAEEREREEARRMRELERVEERVAELTTQLGLGTGQARELRDVLIDTELRRGELRDELRAGGGGWGEARTQFETLRDESDARLKSVLTADQYAQYQEDDRSRFRGFGGGPGGPGGDGGGRR